jgi:hypothetical protein
MIPRQVPYGGAKDDQALRGLDHCYHGGEGSRGVNERVQAQTVHPGLAYIHGQPHPHRVHDERRVRCEAVGGRAQNIDVIATREHAHSRVVSAQLAEDRVESEREERRSQWVALVHPSQREDQIVFAQPEGRSLAALASENKVAHLRDVRQGLP